MNKIYTYVNRISNELQLSSIQNQSDSNEQSDLVLIRPTSGELMLPKALRATDCGTWDASLSVKEGSDMIILILKLLFFKVCKGVAICLCLL